MFDAVEKARSLGTLVAGIACPTQRRIIMSKNEDFMPRAEGSSKKIELLRRESLLDLRAA